jgi:signal transduction histidine kinase
MGIGLAIARRIVEAHGGAIWIEDADGGGCAVLFTLPIDPDGAEGVREETPREGLLTP